MSVRAWVDDIEIELGDRVVSAPTTYQLIDIKNISARKGSYTKTVTVPATALNDKVMGIARDINATNQFDKYTDHRIRIEENSEVVFLGLMRLTDVNEAEIEFFCFAELSKLKNLFGDLTLNDLNLSDLDHTYDETIFDTWDGVYPVGVPEDYFYPLIDYGRFGLLTPAGDPESPDILITDVYPALYLYRAIRQMLLDNGYTLVTSFFDDPQCAKLLIPFSNETFIHDNVKSLELQGFWGEGSIYEILDGTTGTETIDIDVEVYDALNQFDTSTNEFIAAISQTSAILFQLSFNILNNITNPVPAYLVIERFDTATWNELERIPMEGPTPYFQNITWNSVQTFAIGEGIRFRIEKNEAVADIEIGVPEYTIDPAAGGKTIEVGEIVQMAPNLPLMKQVDLFKACYQMFSWVVSVDDVEGVVYIETDTVFYQNGSQEDKSELLVLDPLPSIQYKSLDFARKYDFKYKHDTNDYWLSRANAEQAGIGNFKFGDGNLYLTERGEAITIGEVPFSPTVIAPTFRGAGTSAIDMPTMLLNTDPVIKNTAHNARILINAGLINLLEVSKGVYSELYVEGYGMTNYIPMCYFQKKKYNNTNIDAFTMNLSFSTPAGAGYMLGNLIDLYYRKNIGMLATAAQVTAWFNLTSRDVSNLDYSVLWYIDYYNATFRLNRIVDYLPGRGSPTKVELIKVGIPAPLVTYQEFQ